MSDSYLSHKSWHPASIRNMERVWIEEEKEKVKDKKSLERMKKLKEERDHEHLKRLQVQAGLLPASALDRQEWIHDWGNKVSEREKEEYLLGKPVGEKDSRKSAFGFIVKEKRVNSTTKNEEFSKLHEDPLFMIRQEEMKQKKEIMNNPVFMRKICNEVEQEGKKSRDRKSSKSKKKDKKEKRSKRKSSVSEDRNDRDQSRTRRRPSPSRTISMSRSRSRSKSLIRDSAKKDAKVIRSPLFSGYLHRRLGSNVKFDLNNFKPDFNINKRDRQNRNNQGLNQDRSKAIEEMKRNALDILAEKTIQAKSFEDAGQSERVNNSFIMDLRKQVYDKDEQVTDLGDRMARNVHYYQKDSEGRKSLMECVGLEK